MSADSIVSLNNYSPCGPVNNICGFPPMFLQPDGPFCPVFKGLSEVNLFRYQALVKSALLNRPSYDLLVRVSREYLMDNRSDFRILIALPDGRVIFDSSRADDLLTEPALVPAANDNSFQNALNGTIGENHNTRISILNAQLLESGLGYEQRFSTTTLRRETYIAKRLGAQFDNFGTFRLSLQA